MWTGGNAKFKGSLSSSDHEITDVRILKANRRMKSKLTILDFRRTYFGLLKDQFGRVIQNKALEGLSAQGS